MFPSEIRALQNDAAPGCDTMLRLSLDTAWRQSKTSFNAHANANAINHQRCKRTIRDPATSASKCSSGFARTTAQLAQLFSPANRRTNAKHRTLQECNVFVTSSRARHQQRPCRTPRNAHQHWIQQQTRNTTQSLTRYAIQQIKLIFCRHDEAAVEALALANPAHCPTCARLRIRYGRSGSMLRTRINDGAVLLSMTS